MIQSNGRWVLEEDEEIYGEYLETVGKKRKRASNVASHNLVN